MGKTLSKLIEKEKNEKIKTQLIKKMRESFDSAIMITSNINGKLCFLTLYTRFEYMLKLRKIGLKDESFKKL